MSNTKIEMVTPTETEILLPVNQKCSQISCKSTFQNSSHLRLHLLKHHKIAASELTKSSKGPQRFHCPCPTCKYNLSSSEALHFRTMKLLRQHFLKVHAEKTLCCSNCASRFASNALLSTHMLRCGSSFRCVTCDWVYGSHEALTTHCRRKKHQMPVGKSKEVRNHIESNSKTTQTIETSESSLNNETVFLDVWQKRAQTQSTLVQTQCSNPIHMDIGIGPDGGESNGFSTNTCSVQTDLNLNGYNFANTLLANSFAYEDNFCHIETQTDMAGLDCGGSSSTATDSNRLSPMIFADIHTQTQCDEFLLGWTHIETQTCFTPSPAPDDDLTDFLNCTESPTSDNLSSETNTKNEVQQTAMDLLK